MVPNIYRDLLSALVHPRLSKVKQMGKEIFMFLSNGILNVLVET